MYCSKCGNKLNENDKFCPRCGNSCSEEEKTYNINTQNTNSSPEPMAIGGLICGIIGIFVSGIPLGIIALVLGILSHKQAVKNRKSTAMSTWSITLGGIDILLAIMALDYVFSFI